ncbi:MAG TPA: hypothetical protein VEV45_20850 [Streptosporangiaceae bacterium]|nr:hypothetical protein [Streptosporangiaceae bacterium]
MTATDGDRVVIPLRPVDHADEMPPNPEANAQPARTREGGRWSLPTITLPSIMTGSNLLAAQPPSLLATWDLHARSAKFYDSKILKGLRYTYGALHTYTCAAPGYLIIWVAASFPRLLATVVVLVAALLLLGVL